MKSLSDIRKKYGLTRASIANATGLSVAAIGHYERGDRQPRITTARKLVESVNRLTNGAEQCSIESLFPTTKN